MILKSPETSLSNSKSFLRQVFKNLLNSPNTNHHIPIASKIINLKLSYWITQNSFSHLLCYYPLQHEVNILPFYRYCLSQQKTLYFPTIEDEKLVFYELHQLRKPHHNGLFQEPLLTKRAFSKKLLSQSCIFVPGFAFDELGYRVGFGAGYFDSFLQKNQLQSVGISFHNQLVERIEFDSWDIPMKNIITENIIKTIETCSNRKK